MKRILYSLPLMWLASFFKPATLRSQDVSSTAVLPQPLNHFSLSASETRAKVKKCTSEVLSDERWVEISSRGKVSCKVNLFEARIMRPRCFPQFFFFSLPIRDAFLFGLMKFGSDMHYLLIRARRSFWCRQFLRKSIKATCAGSTELLYQGH